MFKTIIAHLVNDKLWDEINEAFHEGGGVYRLFSKKDGKIQAVERVTQRDLTGTLYIGKANIFNDRVIKLKTTISEEYKSTAHVCGRRYHLENRTALREKYPIQSLWVELEGDSDPKKREREVLEEYIKKFGESPPLNAMDY